MKKINLRGILEILNEGELKNVKGGSLPPVGGIVYPMVMPDDMEAVSPDGDGGGGNKSGVCGGGDGTIVGYRCPGLECYVDIRCNNGRTICDYPMPFVVCQRGTDVCR